MSDRLRFGQIGIAHTHATKCVTDTSRALLEKLNVEFTGIHEPDPEMWKAWHGRKEYFGVRWLDSADELLNDTTINAIFIETWPRECIPWARRALLTGKHIHLDKPPGLSLPDLRSLFDIDESKGKASRNIFQHGLVVKWLKIR